MAVRLLHMSPHSADVERLFSTMGWFNSGKRSRLSPGTNADMVAIRTHFLPRGDNARLRRAQPMPDGGVLTMSEDISLLVR